MSSEINQTQAVAITLFASALIERCQEMIARLTDPGTVVDEIAAFRSMALGHLRTAAISIPVTDEGAARRLAAKHVEEICAAWLGEQFGTEADRIGD